MKKNDYNLNMYLPKETMDKLKKVCDENDVSVSAQIRILINEFLKKQE